MTRPFDGYKCSSFFLLLQVVPSSTGRESSSRLKWSTIGCVRDNRLWLDLTPALRVAALTLPARAWKAFRTATDQCYTTSPRRLSHVARHAVRHLVASARKAPYHEMLCILYTITSDENILKSCVTLTQPFSISS